MPDDHAPADVHVDEALRRRWILATTVMSVFLVALFAGLWVGGDLFAS